MTSQKQQLNEQKMINHLSTVGILGNVILTAFKLLAGIIGHSGAMISDAVHSLSDVFATFIAFLGVKLSKKSADSEHPYGHDRLECVASMVLAAILLATGIGIGMSGVKTIIAGDYSHLQAPGTIALVAAIVSILTKEGMFWYTRHYAKILDSAAFMADAWHHRSDAFSSVGSLIGRLYQKEPGSRKTGSVKNENVRQQGVYRCRDCSRWNTFVERCACNCRGCARQCRKEVSEYKAYYDSCKSGIMEKNTAAFKF